ncbi:MAG: hypothetical protein LKJ86_09415 [Oscillibacter sp.]|nr:hypothetical protein [Oscillibacter sp.]
MSQKRRAFAAPAVGGSSLLVIFAVLCLTVFAMLSLSTVQANKRLSDRNAQAVSDYYAADTQAEKILALLRDGAVPDGVQVENNVYSYSVPISQTQELQVKVRADSDAYVVLCWQAVSTTDWQPDESINVWDGETSE